MKQKYKISKQFYIFIIAAALVGLSLFIWRQNSIDKSDTFNAATPVRLSGQIQALHIPAWGVKVEFKDAHHTKYLVTELESNQINLHARGIIAPGAVCKDLGVALFRSKSNNPTLAATQLGDNYYYLTESPESCALDTAVNDQLRLLKAQLGDLVLNGEYLITEL